MKEDQDFEEEEEGVEATMDSELRGTLGDHEGVVDSDFIQPRQIDSFWLQRRLGKYSDDAIETQRLANEVLTALKVGF